MTGKRVLRLPVVMDVSGLSRSGIYASKDFPRPIKLGRRAVGWLESEVLAWIEKRIDETRNGSAA